MMPSYLTGDIISYATFTLFIFLFAVFLLKSVFTNVILLFLFSITLFFDTVAIYVHYAFLGIFCKHCFFAFNFFLYSFLLLFQSCLVSIESFKTLNK